MKIKLSEIPKEFHKELSPYITPDLYIKYNELIGNKSHLIDVVNTVAESKAYLEQK